MSPTRRVAVLADYLESGWTSMDEYASILVDQHCRAGLEAVLIRPPFRARLGRLPGSLLRRQRRALDHLLNVYGDYPRAAGALGPFDIGHVADHTYAHLIPRLGNCPAVVTCHDIDLYQPPSGATRNRWLIRWTAKRSLAGLRLASRVICVSTTTRDQLVSNRLVDPRLVAVVPQGTDDCFRREGDRTLSADAEARLAATGAKRFLLHVGAPIPRKRIDLLLRMFALIRHTIPEMGLARVGGPLGSAPSALGISSAVAEMPFLSRIEVAALYRRVELLALTSDSEGFGMPVLEAMASGVPVVARDLPAVRELAGDAARYVASDDPREFAATALAVLRDPGMRARLVARGLARAASSRWDRTARRTREIYDEVIEERRALRERRADRHSVAELSTGITA